MIARPLRAAALVLLVVVYGCAADAPAPDAPLRIGFLAPADSTRLDAFRGAQLGADEIAHGARLLGRDVDVLVERADSTPAGVRAAAQRLIAGGATVLVGGYEAPTCRTLAEVADAERIIFLNAGCNADELRASRGYTFHVQPSAAQWRTASGGAVTARPETRVSWHGGLGRYGAAQLNRRFAERFGAPAGETAWASWMALKIAWESALGARSTEPAALRTYLLNATTEFDGHKGQALRFDPATHQLEQPLFAAPSADETAASPSDPRTVVVRNADALRAAVAAGTQLALVTNEGSSDVTIIDVPARAAIATIGLISRPRGVRAGSDRRHAYVAISDDAPEHASNADAIAVIDLARAQVVAFQRAGSDPEQFAIAPDGSRLYSANEDAGTATITDATSGEIITTLVVGIEPEGVASSPDGRWVYVTAETSNTVTVIDARSGSVAANFMVDVRPRAAAFSPDSRWAYVTNEISGTLSIVDVAQHAVIATVVLDGGRARPVGVVASPDGKYVYVANGRANTASVVDAVARREVAVIPVGERPWGIDVTSDGATILTANGGSNDVSVIDAAARRVMATVPVGERPWGVVLTY